MENASPWRRKLMAEKESLAAKNAEIAVRNAEIDGELERITALERDIQVRTKELRVMSDNINAKELQHIKDVKIEENAVQSRAALLSAAERSFAAAADKMKKAYNDMRAANSDLRKLRNEIDTQEKTSRKKLPQGQKNIDCEKSSLASKISELEQEKAELQRLKDNFAAEKVANEDPSTACPMQANLARVESSTEQQRDVKDERPVEEVVHSLRISEPVSEDAPKQRGRASTVGITSAPPAADTRDDVQLVHDAIQRSRAFTCNAPPRSDTMPKSPGANTIPASLIDMSLSKDVDSFEAVVSGGKIHQSTKSQAPDTLPMMDRLELVKYKPEDHSLHQSHRVGSEPTATTKTKAFGYQEANIRAASEMLGSTQGTIKVETKSRAPLSVKKQQGQVYGQEMDECSLSPRYPMVVYVAMYKAWCELKCYVCGANSVKGEHQFFAGVRGLLKHMSSHGSYPRGQIVEACFQRKIAPEHAQRLLSGALLSMDERIKTDWGADGRKNKLRDGVIVPANDSGPDAARSVMPKGSATTSLEEKSQTTSSVVEPCDSDDELLQHTGILRSGIKKEYTGDEEDEWSVLTVHHA